MDLEELKNNILLCRERISKLDNILQIDNKEKEKKSIQNEMAKEDFWNNKQTTIKYTKRLNLLNNILSIYNNLSKKSKNLNSHLNTVYEFKNLNEIESVNEFLHEIEQEFIKLDDEIKSFEMIIFFSEKYDNNNAYISIHAGAGGTESCDWVLMLSRMYDRWFDKKGWNNTTVNYVPGEETGIKSITKLISGNLVYGYLKSEFGVHRLVRISPFDSNARRHTSFASVDITPEILTDNKVIINEKDLRIDTYKSSGAGGQHVNTTDSAVRIIHLPTGIVVSCQNERSQHKNKETAMNILTSKLEIMEKEQRQNDITSIKGNKVQGSWGNQIRSYVLYPYKMVKDLRTNVISNDPNSVLNGELDIFVESWLRYKK